MVQLELNMVQFLMATKLKFSYILDVHQCFNHDLVIPIFPSATGQLLHILYQEMATLVI